MSGTEGDNLPTLPGYEFSRALGAGTTGTVYMARQVSTDRNVAVKVLAPPLLDAPGFRSRFRAEARLMTRFDDENLVNVYDYVEPGDGAYLVMQYVPGVPLRALMLRGHRLSPEQSLGVLSGALSGLAAAHRLGVVHGDLKPENVLVSEQGVSKLVDFGQASPSGSRSSGGTPAYASPEALRDETVDARADVYAAGVILYELLAGHPLFEGSAAEVAAAHRDTVPPRLAEVCGTVADLVARSLSKSPDDRPGSAAEFLDDLRNAAEDCYGAGWEGRAAIVGLVAAAAGGAVGVAAAAETGGAAASTAAPTASSGPPPPTPPPSGRGLRRQGRTKPRIGLAVATAAVVVGAAGVGAAAAVGAFSSGHHRGSAPTVALASCVVGTWQSEGGQGDDVWSGIPVGVSAPKSALNGTIRYSPDGTWESIDPAGEPPSIGTFHGAVFVDQVYGESTGKWTTQGTKTLLVTSLNFTNLAGVLYAGYAHQTSSRTEAESLAGVTRSAEQVSCSDTTLTVFYTIRYQGQTLISQTRYDKRPAGGVLPNPAPVFPQTSLLGGIDLDAYCQSLGATGATLMKPLTGSGAATDNWACSGGRSTGPVDMNAACQWQFYYHQSVTARAVDPNAAFSWLCYGGAENSFTIQPSVASAGSTVVLRSVTPCPVGQSGGPPTTSVGLSFGYFDRGTYNFISGFAIGSGQPSGARGSVLPDGQWTFQYALPSLGLQTNEYYGSSGVDAGKRVNIVPGKYYFTASCSSGGQAASANYRPQFVTLP